jgi:hypothetical protein
MVIVVVMVAMSVAVADLAGQRWRVVARAVGVAVTGGVRGGGCNSNGRSGSDG